MARWIDSTKLAAAIGLLAGVVPFVVPIAAPSVSELGEDRSAPNDAEFDAECTTNVNDRTVVNVSYRGG